MEKCPLKNGYNAWLLSMTQGVPRREDFFTNKK